MSVSIDIIPLSDTLEMYGDPDASSAYSLSGHISISIASTSSIFENRRAVRLLLQSLTITFEGQTEVITPEIGYTPLRLSSMTRELAPSEHLDLTNEGHEDADKPCTWNVVFNLPIPGWLPATSAFGDTMDEDAGTRYSLFATAHFLNMDDNSNKTWSLSTLCSMFRPKTRVIHAPKCAITLRRFVNPPQTPFSSDSLFPMSNYAIRARPEFANATRDSSFIPLDILSKIQLVVSVPDCISMDESSIPFAIRMRTTDLEEVERKRLRVTSFDVDVEQIEKYRALILLEDSTSYPIPSPSLQPPNKPLLDPHRFHRLYDSGLVCAATSGHRTVSRSFSILPPEVSGSYQLAGDGYIFVDESSATEELTWYAIDTTVPLTQRRSRSRELRVSGNSPLFDVGHGLHVAITCTYDVPDTSSRATERLKFSIPLRFVHVTPTPISPSLSPPPSLIIPGLSAGTPSTEILTRSSPYVHSLPAYSQLFDSNGDRKIDYSVPLPLYTPHSSISSPLAAVFRAASGKALVSNVSPEEEREPLTDVSHYEE